MSPTSYQTAPPRGIINQARLFKADDRTRTDNLLITNQLLCQLSHIGTKPYGKWMGVDSNHRSNLQQIYSLSPLATRETIHKMNGTYRARTYDPLLVRQMLSQLS